MFELLVRPPLHAITIPPLPSIRITPRKVRRWKSRLPVLRIIMVHARLNNIRFGADALAFQRNTIWKNSSRNQRVADIALAAIGRGSSPFGLRPWLLHLLPYQDNGTNAAVIVETEEHATILREAFLPDWSIRSLADAGEDSSYSIVTLAYILKHGHPARIYIRATGGARSFNTQWKRLLNSVTPALLIDLYDRAPGRVGKQSFIRLQDYERSGHEVLEVSDVPYLGIRRLKSRSNQQGNMHNNEYKGG